MFDENSSNSDENIDFKGLLKKVDYEGQILDSQEEQSQSQEIKKVVRRKNYSKRISSLLEEEAYDNQKTKNIKKNCISAKQSRQRKKIYIEALEKTADDLKKQIVLRKARIASNRDAIMAAIKLTNPQKSRFISEYLEDNRNLAEHISKLKAQNESANNDKNQKNQKNEKNEKHEKQKQKQKQKLKQKQKQKQENDKTLQHMINSYLYKFGFTGVLRRDVLEQLKMKWYELAIDENIIMNGRHNQLKIILEKFKSCMNQLQKKGLELEYLFRNLQYNLSQEDIVKFIINPEFLIATQTSKIDLHEINEIHDIKSKSSEIIKIQDQLNQQF